MLPAHHPLDLSPLFALHLTEEEPFLTDKSKERKSTLFTELQDSEVQSQTSLANTPLRYLPYLYINLYKQRRFLH